MQNPSTSLISSMHLLLQGIKNQEKIKVALIFKLLAGTGYATLIVLFSLPFCFPIQIPGLSTPFGVILAYMGLRIAFGQKEYWPQWILEKEIKTKNIEILAQKILSSHRYFAKIVYPRLEILCSNSFFYHLHGIVIFFLALLLALPLPIPFSNMLAAVPIFLIGCGLLEKDGVLILLGYLLTILCFFFFFSLYLFGKAQFSNYL